LFPWRLISSFLWTSTIFGLKWECVVELICSCLINESLWHDWWFHMVIHKLGMKWCGKNRYLMCCWFWSFDELMINDDKSINKWLWIDVLSCWSVFDSYISMVIDEYMFVSQNKCLYVKISDYWVKFRNLRFFLQQASPRRACCTTRN
jgi:hypothetical protein